MVVQQHGFLMLECLLSILLLTSGVAAITALYGLDLEQRRATTVRRRAIDAVSALLEDCRAQRKAPLSTTITQGPITILLDARPDEVQQIPFSWITITAEWHAVSGAVCSYTVRTGMVHA